MTYRLEVSVEAQAILVLLSPEQVETLVGCTGFGQFIDGLENHLSSDCPCPYCKIDPKKNTVLYRGRGKGGWIAWKVGERYSTRKSTLLHQILLFPKRHVRNPWELTIPEQLGYFRAINWAHANFEIPGGGIINRFGDTQWNVGTILHMHATIMVPNRKGRVIIPLQKSRGMHRAHYKRMLGFLERYVAGERA